VFFTGGETEEERIRVDILENQLMDNRMVLARLCYNADFVSPALGWMRWGNQSLYLCLLICSVCLASNVLALLTYR
jgi:hypothetical protein